MRILYVVQRYGEQIAGGAEQHARAFAERTGRARSPRDRAHDLRAVVRRLGQRVSARLVEGERCLGVPGAGRGDAATRICSHGSTPA